MKKRLRNKLEKKLYNNLWINNIEKLTKENIYKFWWTSLTHWLNWNFFSKYFNNCSVWKTNFAFIDYNTWNLIDQSWTIIPSKK